MESLFSGDQQNRPRMISFASAKGGVGTSILAANLGIQLAKKGRSVLLVDAALTEASCHLALGMGWPERHLGALVAKKSTDPREAIVATPVNGLSVLAGAPDVPGVANMAYLLKQKLLDALAEMPFEYVLIDAGAGTGADTLDFTLAGGTLLLVCQPAPATLEPFYRFVRALLHRLLQGSLNKKRYQALAGSLNEASPLDGLWDNAQTSQEDLEAVEREIRSRRFSFVLTGLSSDKEGRLGHQIEFLARRHFLLPIRYLGGVEWDPQAAAAVRDLEAIAKAYPMCPFSMATERLANILLKEDREQKLPEGHLSPKPLSEQHAYDVLDLAFDASAKEIQAAYQKLQEPYQDASLLTVGLYDREEREAIRDRLEWAYRTLITTRERQRYDEELLAREIMRPEERVSEYRETLVDGALVSPPPFKEGQRISSEDPASRRERMDEALRAALEEIQRFDGKALRKVREAQGISIEEIVSETCIRSWYIESIEMERFDALPALVYLKGFVRQIAQYLHLDPERVLSDYIKQYDRWRQGHPE